VVGHATILPSRICGHAAECGDAAYPVWSLIYIAIAVMVIYGLAARYGEQAA